MMGPQKSIVRLRVYLGEDKRHGDEALFTAILRKAREMNIAGATLFRGIEGFGRSTRLHTYEVLASEDLPVVIEIIDHEDKVAALREILTHLPDIGLITSERLEAVWGAAEERR